MNSTGDGKSPHGLVISQWPQLLIMMPWAQHESSDVSCLNYNTGEKLKYFLQDKNLGTALKLWESLTLERRISAFVNDIILCVKTQRHH